MLTVPDCKARFLTCLLHASVSWGLRQVPCHAASLAPVPTGPALAGPSKSLLSGSPWLSLRGGPGILTAPGGSQEEGCERLPRFSTLHPSLRPVPLALSPSCCRRVGPKPSLPALSLAHLQRTLPPANAPLWLQLRELASRDGTAVRDSCRPAPALVAPGSLLQTPLGPHPRPSCRLRPALGSNLSGNTGLRKSFVLQSSVLERRRHPPPGKTPGGARSLPGFLATRASHVRARLSGVWGFHATPGFM